MTTHSYEGTGIPHRVLSAKQRILERALREYEEDRCFDRMEIARAMAAVAFKRVEMNESPEQAADFYRSVQQLCERRLVARNTIVRDSALQEKEQHRKRSIH